MTDAERKERKAIYNRIYRERKKERETAALNKPIPDNMRLSVIIGENSYRCRNHIVIQTFPIANGLCSVSVVRSDRIDVRFFNSSEEAFASIGKRKIKHYRDFSAEALADYERIIEKERRSNHDFQKQIESSTDHD